MPASIVLAATLVCASDSCVKVVERELTMKVDREAALKIARDDAATQYRDLSLYDVRIEQAQGAWKIDYELKDKHAQGGGPHYVISAETGAIISRRYEQ